MAGDGRILTETTFNIVYLIVIWGLVWAMFKRRMMLAADDRNAALCILLAFFFLALGDTGHVGFRVVAYALGGLETTMPLFGKDVNLVAMGAVATAWTFTIFYVFMLLMWQERFKEPFGLIAWLMVVMAIARSVVMLLPGNEWNSLNPPRTIYVLRNIPLMLMQAGTAFLILRDAARRHDRTFRWIGIMILISLACYGPVVAFVHTYPAIGMLMIPKTMAYLGIAIIGYRGLYRVQETSEVPA
jgi:hypothetical protein